MPARRLRAEDLSSLFSFVFLVSAYQKSHVFATKRDGFLREEHKLHKYGKNGNGKKIQK